MQPGYIPWLGYFDRIAQADLFVVLDHVRMDRNSQTKFCNRNKIRTAHGWTWLTIPIQTKGVLERPINEIRLTEDITWRRKHFQALKNNYSRAEYFGEHLEFFENVYKKEWDTILPYLLEINGYLLDSLKIDTEILLSSKLDLKQTKSDLILEICQLTKATKYLSGPFGRHYLNSNSFSDCGIEIEYHDYVHPVYTQLYGGFESHLSVLDLIFNHGPLSLKILKS